MGKCVYSTRAWNALPLSQPEGSRTSSGPAYPRPGACVLETVISVYAPGGPLASEGTAREPLWIGERCNKLCHRDAHCRKRVNR